MSFLEHSTSELSSLLKVTMLSTNNSSEIEDRSYQNIQEVLSSTDGIAVASALCNSN